MTHRIAAHSFRIHTNAAKSRFMTALTEPESVQRKVLEDLKNLTNNSLYWRDQNVSLESLQKFKRTVRIREYAAFEEIIAKESITHGGMLTCSPVLRWLKTSGTTGRPKQIPYTQHWMRKYRIPAMHAMWGTFIDAAPQILSHEHALLDTQSVRAEVAPSVHGLAHQSISNRHPKIDEYDWDPPWYNSPWYGPHTQNDHDTRMYINIRYFIGRDLRGITAINPSMILAIADAFACNSEQLARDVYDGTLKGKANPDFEPDPNNARRLEKIINQPEWGSRR